MALCSSAAQQPLQEGPGEAPRLHPAAPHQSLPAAGLPVRRL